MAFSAAVLFGCGGKDDPSPGPVINGGGDTPAPEKFDIGSVLPAWEEGYLDIHCINGGRGEAFYYILPDGTTMLIDAAGAPPNELTSYDSDSPGVASRPSVNINSGKVIVNYIKHFAPSIAGGKLDYFVSSHYHGDHIGSWRSDFNKYGWTPYDKNGSPVSSINLNDGGFLLNGLAEVGLAIPIVKVLDRGDWDKPASEEYGTDSGNKRYQLYLNFLDYAKRKNGTVRETFKVGTTDQILLKHDPGKYSGFKVRSVAAGGHVWTGSGTQEATQFPSVEECLKNKDKYSIGENHLSCVLLMQYGSFDHFTGGDICYNGYSTYSWKHVEKTIAKAMKKVEVMKASHHSTNNTNSTELLSVLKPDIYIAGVWRAVQPSPTTLKRVLTANPNTKIFTTNLDASNVTTLKADGIDPATFGCTGGHVVVRVAKGGTKYWVLVLNDSNEEYKISQKYGPYTCL